MASKHNKRAQALDSTVESGTIRLAFYDWLTNEYAKKFSPEHIVDSFDNISEQLLRRKLSPFPLWEITNYAIFKTIYDEAINDKLFRVTDKKTHASLMQIGRLYLKFLKNKTYLNKALTISSELTNQLGSCLTIKEAIILVLDNAQQGMTVEQIFQKIVADGLYSFGAKNPQNVIRVEIDRACANSNYTIRASKNSFRFERNQKGEKVYYLLDTHDIDELGKETDITSCTHKPPIEDSQSEEMRIEKFIKSADICGAKISDIVAHVSPSGRGIAPIRKYLSSVPWAVAMPGDLYIHRDCIIDFDEAADKMLKILKLQFSMFNGYTTDTVFHDAVKIELAMFLNDNDFADSEKVYCLAKHIFSVDKYGGNAVFFYGNKHIWETEPEMPKSISGVLMSFIKSCGGKATRDECANYLDKLKIASGNINGLLRIDSNRDVLQYRSGEFLLPEVLGIDDHWLGRIKSCLDVVSEDRPYIVLRALNRHWFCKLPSLPIGLNWQILLLQEVIQKFIPEYRAIQALDGQSFDTIKAGIVRDDSVINTFADLVHAYLVIEDVLSLPTSLAAEELRALLKQFGMIDGNELIYNMHKSLNDRRFAWSSDNSSVKILEK